MGAVLEARSIDGTRVAAHVSGDGPALLVVHGIAGDATRWTLVRPRLAERFTVYAMDRRGRGASQDAAIHSIALEAEDVAALVRAIGGDVFVLGHSYGGLVALEAARIEPRIARLMVYEPYFWATPLTAPSEPTLRYARMLEAGDRAEVLETFCREIVQMSDKDVARMRAHPSWDARVACAHTLVREMGAVEQHRFDASNLRMPLRMLVGSESPAFLKDATERLHGKVPGSDVVVLPGQSHIAMDTAPDLFVSEVLAFFG
jgi:pimeloyl-ACP methyl ester carboxylesterase